MYPIARQSDQYAVFDAPPRREKVAHGSPPESVIREFTRGPVITAGTLNTRQAKKTWCPDCQKIVPEGSHTCGDEDDEDSHRKESVNTYGMDPEEHAYHGELPWGPGGEVVNEEGARNPRREWDPNYGYEPTDLDERLREQVGEDDESGYNWGPAPHGIPESQVGPSAHPFGTPIYNPRSSPYDNISGRRLGFNRQAEEGPVEGDALGANLFGDVSNDPELFTYMFRARPPDERAYMLGGLGVLTPGSRVGLPYNGTMIPGVVTHFSPDSQVGVRWHDGQHSVEDPGDIRPL